MLVNDCGQVPERDCNVVVTGFRPQFNNQVLARPYYATLVCDIGGSISNRQIRQSVNILFIVNDSPWGTSLSATALRLAQSATASGHEVAAVFFRGDGVYAALRGAASDAGAANLHDAWVDLGEKHSTRLLLCQSSLQRRLEDRAEAPFQVAGLAEMVDLSLECDRVVTF